MMFLRRRLTFSSFIFAVGKCTLPTGRLLHFSRGTWRGIEFRILSGKEIRFNIFVVGQFFLGFYL